MEYATETFIEDKMREGKKGTLSELIQAEQERREEPVLKTIPYEQ